MQKAAKIHFPYFFPVSPNFPESPGTGGIGGNGGMDRYTFFIKIIIVRITSLIFWCKQIFGEICEKQVSILELIQNLERKFKIFQDIISLIWPVSKFPNFSLKYGPKTCSYLFENVELVESVETVGRANFIGNIFLYLYDKTKGKNHFLEISGNPYRNLKIKPKIPFENWEISFVKC